MDDELRRRIAEDLRKAGFESEMLAIEEFAVVDGNARAASATTIGIRTSAASSTCLQDSVCLERDRRRLSPVRDPYRRRGQKAERPWVVLRERTLATDELIDAWTNLTYGFNLPADHVTLAEKLSMHSLLQRNGWQGRGIHESFKHPTGASSSYGACVSVCKAAESALEAEEASFGPLRTTFEDSIFFTLIKPVIVVDGILVSATVASDASIDLSEISSAVLRFQFQQSITRGRNTQSTLFLCPTCRPISSCRAACSSFPERACRASSDRWWRYFMTALVFDTATHRWDFDRFAMAFVCAGSA